MKDVDIEKVRTACKAAALTLARSSRIIKPGITTNEINTFVHNDTIRQGGYPAPLNYRRFPKSVCTSVNDVVCHGIPGNLVLKDGDIINVDVTTIVDGHFGDTSATFIVGQTNEDITRLVEVTHLALNAAITCCGPGMSMSVIGRRIQEIADDYGYGVVKELGGHGLGTRFHTRPFVVHHDVKDVKQELMQPGMIFTIEPMICMRSPEIKVDADGWTIRTLDGSWSAQFEATILVTEDGTENLTKID